MVHRVEKEPRLRTSCLLRRGKKNFKYISKFLGFQIIYVNFRLLSPTDSGRAGRSVVGNWIFRLMSVAHQKLDVGPDFGRKFGALVVSCQSLRAGVRNIDSFHLFSTAKML